MRFIIQRRTDYRYYKGEKLWVSSEEEAFSFSTYLQAYELCRIKPQERLDVLIRLDRPSEFAMTG